MPADYHIIFHGWENQICQLLSVHRVNKVRETQKHIPEPLVPQPSSSEVETAINTFTAIVDLSRFNNSCLKSPASTLVDLTFQSRALRSFSLNQLRNLSL